MTVYEKLMESAREIPEPGNGAASEYGALRLELAAMVTRALLAREDAEALIGKDGASLAENNHRNHAQFMSAVFVAFSPENFVNTVAWAIRVYLKRGFSPEYWPVAMDLWEDAICEKMTEDNAAETLVFYEWMRRNFSSLRALAEDQAFAPHEQAIHGQMSGGVGEGEHEA